MYALFIEVSGRFYLLAEFDTQAEAMGYLNDQEETIQQLFKIFEDSADLDSHKLDYFIELIEEVEDFNTM